MTLTRLCLITSLLLFITGCVSQILKSYVGQDIRVAMLDYGHPTNEVDMGNGIRAFQWLIKGQYQTPYRMNTQGDIHMLGNTANYGSNTTITGGNILSTDCFYTLFAQKDGNSWIVTGYRTPKKLICG